jgi:hypothetical protein
MNNGDMPASPITSELYPMEAMRSNLGSMPTGLTKRERFAMAAMQGMISSGDMELAEDGVESFIAECLVKYADALLAELAKEKSA